MQKQDIQKSIYHPSLKVNTMHENNIGHIRWLIGMIEAYDLKESFEVLYNYVGNLLNEVPVIRLTLKIPDRAFDPESPGESIGCFRTRKIKNLSEIKSDTDLWARPKQEVDYYGRCHSPNQEVLYCSSSVGVTLYELDLKKDDLFIVIRYVSTNLNAGMDFTVLGDERYIFEDNAIVNSNKVKSIYESLSKKNREKLRTIEKFVIRSFRKKVGQSEMDKYKVTSAITKFFFHEPGNAVEFVEEKVKIGGVLYPSVKIGEKAYNLAFNNDVAKEHLRIADVFAGKVIDFTSEGYRITLDYKLARTGYNGEFMWEAISC